MRHYAVTVAVIADRSGPLAIDGGKVMVTVPVPAAARAVIGDPLTQPVPLHRTGGGFGVQDQAGKLLAAPLLLGGLVAGQPDAAPRVAVLDVNAPPGRGAVGDLPPAASTCPRQRREEAPAPARPPRRSSGGGEKTLRA